VGETNEDFELLSLEEVQKLDEPNRSDYLALRRMFESSGWKIFQNLLKAHAANALSRQLTAPSWENVLIERGKLAMCEVMIATEKFNEHSYRQIADIEKTTENSLDE